MVFYFTCSDPWYTIYMGRDKYENEHLIARGWPEDLWFHVDNHSSAHVYLRLPKNFTVDEVPDEIVAECSQLTKANSIEGCKLSNVRIVYTPWSNLRKGAGMADGQVGFHDNKLRRFYMVEHRINAIVNRLEKTKVEKNNNPTDLLRLREARDAEEAAELKSQKVEARKQLALEEALLGLAERAFSLSGESNLVLSGGVAMNSVANGRIERDGPFESVWIQSSAGDGGTAIGAALWVWHCIEGGVERHRWANDRFGQSFSDEACREALRKGGWSWTEPEDLAQDTASALADGDLVGWFQGGAELGARALGGRSILADPRKAEHKDVLNARVKFREPFRPFAPSVIEERAEEFFAMELYDPVDPGREFYCSHWDRKNSYKNFRCRRVFGRAIWWWCS